MSGNSGETEIGNYLFVLMLQNVLQIVISSWTLSQLCPDTKGIWKNIYLHLMNTPICAYRVPFMHDFVLIERFFLLTSAPGSA